MTEILSEVTAVEWTLSRAEPLTVETRNGQFEASRSGVAQALRRNDPEAADLAERAVGFRIRPRPGGGRHIITVCGDSSLTSEEAGALDGSLYRVLPMQTASALSPGLNALADRLEPQVDIAPRYRPRVALVTSRSDAMVADTSPHLAGFSDVDHRSFRANDPDASAQLASILRELSLARPRLDAVLLVRGGGDPVDLQRLVSAAVVHEIEDLRDRGVLVVAAFGHGNQHVDVHADFHATTPTAGAQIVRARLHDLPSKQHRAITDHIAHASRIVLDGRVDPSFLATSLAASLTNIATDVQATIERHVQPATTTGWR